jgi:ankyrin repeat protein
MAELRAEIARKRRAAIAAGKGGDVTALPDTPAMRRRRWEEMAAAYRPDQRIRERISVLLSDDGADKAEQMLALGAAFLRAAERGDAARLRTFLEEGFPVTFRDPETGETAFHIAAACRARDALRVLLQSPDCDFLLRDEQGRLPSEMAYIYGEDPAAARLLARKEKQQARHRNIRLTRRPQQA